MEAALTQVDLGLLPEAGQPELAPAALIERIRTRRESYRKCIDEGIRAGRVNSYDEVAAFLSIDAGQFNRIVNSEARHLDDNKELMLERVCGNKIPTQWTAQQDGYELRPIFTALERQLLARDDEIRKLKGELETLIKYGAIRAAGVAP